MFEKFTEKARRTIFFARYEASQHGLAWIDTRCLLLGILREEKLAMSRLLPAGSEELARLTAEVQALFPATIEKIATSVDLPLDHAARRALPYAAEESERLQHKFIDGRHLLLGLLRENGPEAKCLQAHGIELERVRADFPQNPPTDKPGAPQAPGRSIAFEPRPDLLRMLHAIPADRWEAAATLLEGLASGKFEATGTSRNGPFHFSFDDKTE
ncbi:MAG: Clp protease N-terminal domain-containing protein [Bryobacteraceae bacterium]|jgi:ATP-dependent Clp protease ATP-binding subunit ClpC